MSISIHGRTIKSVFGLRSLDENSASFGLGWILEQSPVFCKLLVKVLFSEISVAGEMFVSLQRHDDDGGYTDLELNSASQFHAILEAKRSWTLPSEEQLRRYLPRLIADGGSRRLVSVSAADRTYARRHLPASLDGVPVMHLSWSNLLEMTKGAHRQAPSYREKLWLEQFALHLEEFVSLDRRTDNTVFVVSLSGKPMVEGSAHTWIDVVEKDQRYFHPVGSGWPVEPPNYIGFRYDGRLQSVHHIEAFEVVRNLAEVNPLWVPTDHDHFVYRLGPPMRPARKVRTGNIYPNGRVRCAIDTLLSGAFDTISDARDETQRRLAGAA